MNSINLRALLGCCVAALTLFACSGKGPDVVGPGSGDRTQISLLALDKPGSGELLRYSEVKGVVTTGDYAAANGAPLGKEIDAIYDSYLRDQLYLQHRADGSITVLDMQTRKKLGEVIGLHAGADGLCGMAVSNYSQAWAIASGAPILYEIDTRNYKLAREIDLPGKPTAVGVDSSGRGGYVLVGMLANDGSASVGVTRSNSTDFRIERTINFPSPVLYIEATNDGSQVVVLTAGAPGARPILFFLDGVTLDVTGSQELNSGSLEQYVGQEPTYVQMTRDSYLYLAGSQSVLRVDLTNHDVQPEEFYPGNYRVIGVDRITGLLYAWQQGATEVRRFTTDYEELDPFPVSDEVRDIHFINQYQAR